MFGRVGYSLVPIWECLLAGCRRHRRRGGRRRRQSKDRKGRLLNAEALEAMRASCVKRNASQSDQTGKSFLLTGDACVVLHVGSSEAHAKKVPNTRTRTSISTRTSTSMRTGTSTNT